MQQKRPLLTLPKGEHQRRKPTALDLETPESRSGKDGALAAMASPLIGTRVVATHKAGFLFVGLLHSVNSYAARIDDGFIKSSRNHITGISTIIVRLSHISHLISDDGVLGRKE